MLFPYLLCNGVKFLKTILGNGFKLTSQNKNRNHVKNLFKKSQISQSKYYALSYLGVII